MFPALWKCMWRLEKGFRRLVSRSPGSLYFSTGPWDLLTRATVTNVPTSQASEIYIPETNVVMNTAPPVVMTPSHRIIFLAVILLLLWTVMQIPMLF